MALYTASNGAKNASRLLRHENKRQMCCFSLGESKSECPEIRAEWKRERERERVLR